MVSSTKSSYPRLLNESVNPFLNTKSLNSLDKSFWNEFPLKWVPYVKDGNACIQKSIFHHAEKTNFRPKWLILSFQIFFKKLKLTEIGGEIRTTARASQIWSWFRYQFQKASKSVNMCNSPQLQSRHRSQLWKQLFTKMIEYGGVTAALVVGATVVLVY